MSRFSRWSVFLVLALIAAGAAATPAAAEAKYTMTIATVAPDNTPWSDLLKSYEKDVESKSGGQIDVKVKLGGALGDENDTVLKCKRGQIQAVGASTGAIASQVPELNVIEIPYLLRDFAEADHIIDDVLTAEFDKILPDYDLVLGFWSENGYRSFGTKTKAIKTPADLKGLKMRSQESPIHLDMYKAYGASPQPIATTETLTALENGTVDGFDQALLYALAASWHSSIKYLTISNHIYQPAAIIYNEEWYNKLPADLQKVLQEVGRGIQAKGRKAVRGILPDLVDVFKEEGVTVYELSAAERKVFEDASADVRKSFRKTQGKRAGELLDKIEKELASYRKK
jgi:tripartite ATP-independent transporter DctP family solute receptor